MTAVAESRTNVGTPEQRRPPETIVTLRAVVRRGLRDSRRSVLSWGLPMGAMSAFMAAIYPSIQSMLQRVVETYPEALKQAFGVGNLDTVEGYVHAEMFSLIIPLAIGFFMIRAVASGTVAAEEQGYLDTILTLPISRTVLVVGSYLVAALTSLAIMVLTGVMLFVVGRIAGTDISPGLVAAGVIGVWPVGLFAGAVSALFAGLLHTSRAVDGVGLGVLVGMYAIDLAGRLDPNIQGIRWASVFRYYGEPMRDGIDPVNFFGVVGAATLLVAAGAWLFERRDVYR